MAQETDPAKRRARFLRQLATRDLYAWFGIPRTADAETIQAAAEAMRAKLRSTPMTQAKRATEKAFCDQGEKALLRPDVRREYDMLLGGGQPTIAADAATRRTAGEREARLQAARARVQRYDVDDAVMTPAGVSLTLPAAVAELAEEREAAAGLTDGAAALRAARAARAEGAPLRGLACAERAHEMNPSVGAMRTLGAAQRDVGDLEASATILRACVKASAELHENTPGWAALGATLAASGLLEEADGIALKLLREDDEDAHAWRLLAHVSAAQGDAPRAAEAFERSARLGLDVAGALSGLQALRKDCLARDDRATAADLEVRISRLRPR